MYIRRWYFSSPSVPPDLVTTHHHHLTQTTSRLHIIMDSFATIVSFFTAAPTAEGSSLPTNEETGGSSANAYCVVAWASNVRVSVITISYHHHGTSIFFSLESSFTYQTLSQPAHFRLSHRIFTDFEEGGGDHLHASSYLAAHGTLLTSTLIVVKLFFERKGFDSIMENEMALQ